MTEEFQNFGTDKKGDFARCTRCYKKYYDWNATNHIAFCGTCRKPGKAPRPPLSKQALR